MGEALVIAAAVAVVAALVLLHRRRHRTPPGRLRRFKEGRAVTVPIGVEFRHDGADLPTVVPQVMAARAQVTCSQDRGVFKVVGARMVPGFDDAFWALLAAQSSSGRLRCLKRDEQLLLAVPMAHPPGSGVLVRLGREDLTILAHSLSRAHPGGKPRQQP